MHEDTRRGVHAYKCAFLCAWPQSQYNTPFKFRHVLFEYEFIRRSVLYVWRLPRNAPPRRVDSRAVPCACRTLEEKVSCPLVQLYQVLLSTSYPGVVRSTRRLVPRGYTCTVHGAHARDTRARERPVHMLKITSRGTIKKAEIDSVLSAQIQSLVIV
jgi:hypothetical protein